MPPFEEILVLGKNSPRGKIGISKSFDLLIPNGFEIIDTNHGNVFTFVSEKEILKVDFKAMVSITVIEDETS